MTISPIIPFIIVFIILVSLDSISVIGKIMRNVFLLVFFLFMYANTDLQGAAFYSIMAVSNLVFASIFLFVVRNKAQAQSIMDPQTIQVSKYKFKGKMISIVSFVAGIVLYIIMMMIQSGQPSAIIGVPALSISSIGIKSAIASILGVAFLASLGFIENTFFFSLFEFIKLVMPALSIIPIIGPIIISPIFSLSISLVLVALLFAFFHVAAFGLALGMVIWAFTIFLLWSVSYIFLGEEPSSIAHYFWNGNIGLSRVLSIAR